MWQSRYIDGVGTNIVLVLRLIGLQALLSAGVESGVEAGVEKGVVAGVEVAETLVLLAAKVTLDRRKRNHRSPLHMYGRSKSENSSSSDV